MTKTVVALVGANENGVLAAGSRELLAAMKPHGIDGHVVNLHAPGWTDQLGRLANDGILFAFGFAGIGAILDHIDPVTRAKLNLWDTLRVPFISLLADQPANQPRNQDRKSTRLNSSHQIISYAVFCLKKKKQNT